MNLPVDADALYDQLTDDAVALTVPDIETALEFIQTLDERYSDPFHTEITPITDDEDGTIENYVLAIKKPWYTHGMGWYTVDDPQAVEPYTAFLTT